MQSRPSLTSSDVETMMKACRAEADRHGWKVTIAIVDDGGFLLRLDRMDGASRSTSEVAHGKARTSALTGRPSKFFEDRVKDRPGFVTFPAGLLIQGALPIVVEGHCIGAIGVSGVQSQEDEDIARAGIAALGI